MNDLLKKVLPHLLAIVLAVIVSLIYFAPQLEGKKLEQGDYLTYEGMAKESMDYEKKTGKRPLWTNSMFGGMPTYQISAPQGNNLIIPFSRILFMGMSKPIGFFIMGMICFYILMISLGVRPWIGILAAFCFAFTTNNIVLYHAGHVTKVAVIMISPMIIAGLLMVFKKKYLSGGVVFGLGFALSMTFNHFQMTYYLGIVLGILFMMYFIQALREKDYRHIGITAAVLTVGVILGAGSTASKLWTTYEYGQDTMRGKPILEKTDSFSSSSSEGLSFEYAMTWSNGWEDLLASYIPMVVGGSSGEMLPVTSNVVKDLKKKGASIRGSVPMPTYWGSLPSTSGPIYFGAIVFLLFVLGLALVDGKLKWWIGSAVALTFLFSLGSNLAWFNQLIFDYLPLYNKFRTPNSVLSVTAVIIPILGFYALHKILYTDIDHEKVKKFLIYIGGGFVAFTLILGFVGPSFFDMTGSSDGRLAQAGYDVDALMKDRGDMLKRSSLRTSALILMTFAAIWFYLSNKIKPSVVLGIIAVLCVFDLITMDKRYINNDNFVAERKYKSNFQLRPVDQQILADPNPHYRVHDLTINTFNSSTSSYYHKTVGGMHAAKLQRIQDLIDRHIQQGNQKVLNMLNTRYYIVPDNNNQPAVQMNPAALGNAWFINTIKLVNSANEEIDALNDFDPLGEAIIHKEFTDYVAGFDPEKSGSIELTKYSPDEMMYKSNSNSDQLAVFSEMWYGPNKGWNAYIDGKPVDHIRANYALRAMKIPSGSHEIRFEFKPSTYYTGEIISLISSGILLLMLGYWVVTSFLGWRKNKLNS